MSHCLVQAATAGGSAAGNGASGAQGSEAQASGDPDVRKSALVSESGDGSGTLRIAGIAFGVLLLGGLLGLALRRGLGQHTGGA